jgi:hypothetical protein
MQALGESAFSSRRMDYRARNHRLVMVIGVDGDQDDDVVFPHQVRCRPLIRITPWPRSPEMEYVSWLASHRIYRHYPSSYHLHRGRTVKLTKGWINFSWSYKPKLGILLLSPMPWRGTRMLENGQHQVRFSPSLSANTLDRLCSGINGTAFT